MAKTEKSGKTTKAPKTEKTGKASSIPENDNELLNRAAGALRKLTDQEAVEVTPVSAWKKGKGDQSLTLPSGNVLKVRRAGFPTYVKMGIIPNALMGMVQSAIDKGQKPEESVTAADIEKIDDFIEMMDNIVRFCAVEPKIEAIPTKKDGDGKDVEDPEARDDEVLYIDEVEDEDKMFIYQWAVGGTRDVETFRAEAGDMLVAVRAGQGLEG